MALCRNMTRYKALSRPLGFTLIEVMIVVLVLGFMATAVRMSFVANSPEKILNKASLRFAGIVEVAAEYAMLNSVELGLVIDERSYEFVVFDGERWEKLSDYKELSLYELPENIAIDLVLDDLPIEAPQLFDADTFALDDEDEFYESSFDDIGFEKDSSQEKKSTKKIVPQVYLLSSGDITPFSLRFFFKEQDLLDKPFYYNVTGLYSTPLTIEGPIFDAI